MMQPTWSTRYSVPACSNGARRSSSPESPSFWVQHSASPVMETARKGIFDPTVLTMQMALAVYVSVYFVDTVMLYGFSGFGMPVSTTACLVFALVGGALFLKGPDNINWPKVTNVIVSIIVSIAISGVASFMVMRVFRGAIRDKVKDRDTIMLHGPWITGAMLTWLTWFLVFKGLQDVCLCPITQGKYL